MPRVFGHAHGGARYVRYLCGGLVSDSISGRGSPRRSTGIATPRVASLPFVWHATGLSALLATQAARLLVEREVDLIRWDASQPELAAGCRFALIYRRQADLEQVKFVLDHGQVIAESARQGVWLTRVYRLPASPQELLVRPLPPTEGSP